MNDLVSVQSKMDYTASLITTLSNLETTNDTSLPLAYIDPAKAEYSCNGTTVTPSANPMIDDTVQTKPQTRVSVNSYISQSYSPTSNSTTTSNSSSSSTGGPPGFDLLSSINVNSATFYRDLIKSTDVPDLSNLIDLISPTEAQAIAYGYTADELILECSFDGALCKTSDFSEGYNKRHGKCYTFNDKAETAVNTTKWGSTYGLRVTININISEYIGLLAPEAGVSVSLQTPGSLPVPDMVGISALPGYTTVISFSLTHISRQPYPYTSNCISDFPTAYKPFLPANTTYSLQACQIACVSKAMYDACGCVDRIPMGKYPQCSIKNSTERSCWANISDSQFLPIDNSSALICQCYAACEEAQYVTRVTHSKYPSPAYGLVKMTNFLTMDQIGRFWVGKYNLSANPSKYSTPEWVPDNSPEANLLRVHAFFSDLNYQLIQESPEYPIVRCLSDSGGILGKQKNLYSCSKFISNSHPFYNFRVVSGSFCCCAF